MNDSDIPVLVISFNRPDLTKGAIENIRELAPSLVFFTVDGPRPANQTDLDKIQSVKNLVNQIDWDCEVRTLFAEENKGSGRWPYESITWALGQCECIMILEDDVRVSKDFYTAAKKLIPRFTDIESVFAICASNISRNSKNGAYFTKYFSGWGWITWASKWKAYSFEITTENKITFFDLLKINNYNILITLYFYINFYLVDKNKLKSWDYQINHLLFRDNKVCLKFNKNLSINIGTGINATHTKALPNMKKESIEVAQLEIPDRIMINQNLERKWRRDRLRFILTSWLKRI